MAAQYYQIRCDHDGCNAMFSANVKPADATRSHAAYVGWVHIVVPPGPHVGGPAKSLDYCPEHAADPGDPKHARLG